MDNLFTGTYISSIRPEAQFLFRSISQLKIETGANFLTSLEPLARQVEVFQACQTGLSEFKVAFIFNLARLKEQKESFNLAEILEPIRNFRTNFLAIGHGNEASDFCLDDLSSETFREFDVWHRNLGCLELLDHRIKAINAETFRNFKHLGSLILVRLDLHEINVDAFKGLDALDSLILTENKLKSLESGTFDCLVNLELLRIDGNNLTYLQPDLFQELGNLKKLKLNRNPLSADLHEDTFRGLDNLADLNLAETPLAQVVNLEQSPIIRKHMRQVQVKLVDHA